MTHHTPTTMSGHADAPAFESDLELWLCGPRGGRWLELIAPWAGDVGATAASTGGSAVLRWRATPSVEPGLLDAADTERLALPPSAAMQRRVYFLESPQDWLADRLGRCPETEPSKAMAELLHSFSEAIAWAADRDSAVVVVDTREIAASPHRLATLLGRHPVASLARGFPPRQHSALTRLLAEAALLARPEAADRYEVLRQMAQAPAPVPVTAALVDEAALERASTAAGTGGQPAGAPADLRGLELRQALAFALQRQQASEADARRGAAELTALQRRERHLRSQLEVARYELDALLLDRLRADAGPSSSHRPGALASNLQDVDARVAGVHAEGAHAHVDFVCSGARVGGGPPLPNLRVRLVVHHGRPGLVVFLQPGLDDAFQAWEERGEEGGHRFVAIVPTDAAGRKALARLPSSPHQFLTRVSQGICAALERSSRPAASAWCATAQQLQMQLTVLEPRLRYDGLRVEATSTSTGAEVRFTFEGAELFSQALGHLHVHARRGVGGSGWQLVLVCPDETSRAPLLSWPMRATGMAEPEVAVPGTEPMGTVARLRRWVSLPTRDRTAARAIAEALYQPGHLQSALAALGPDAAQSLALAVSASIRRLGWLETAAPLVQRLLARRQRS